VSAPDDWKVFPVRAETKRPAVIGWQALATSDERQIDGLLREFPGCSWGVATGPSGLWVVDVDTKPGKNGLKWLEGLAPEQRAEIESTFTVRTASGGLHFYFRRPSCERNTASRIAEHVDTRGVGGYVVCPPTPGYEVLREVLPPLDAPEWLLAAARRRSATTRPASGTRVPPVECDEAFGPRADLADLQGWKAGRRDDREQEHAALLAHALAGRAIAEPGDRDTALNRLMSLIATAVPLGTPFEPFADVLRPSLAAMPPDPEDDKDPDWLAEARDMYERAMVRREECRIADERLRLQMSAWRAEVRANAAAGGAK
jgi:hypothetical protein